MRKFMSNINLQSTSLILSEAKELSLNVSKNIKIDTLKTLIKTEKLARAVVNEFLVSILILIDRIEDKKLILCFTEVHEHIFKWVVQEAYPVACECHRLDPISSSNVPAMYIIRNLRKSVLQKIQTSEKMRKLIYGIFQIAVERANVSITSYTLYKWLVGKWRCWREDQVFIDTLKKSAKVGRGGALCLKYFQREQKLKILRKIFSFYLYKSS